MARYRRRFDTSISTYIDYYSYRFTGFTDLVSNAAVLDNISPLSRLKELQQGRLDLTFLPAFIHESAHHASFDAFCGLALSSLWQSAYSLGFDQFGTHIPQQPLRDLVIVTAANKLFQPLLEGLALFCEHDLFIGSSPIVSRVTQRSFPIFARGRLAELLGCDVLQAVHRYGKDGLLSIAQSKMLHERRNSDTWTSSKALLLGQPLVGKNNYLLGYLAVKRMHAELVARCPDFIDPELFFVTVITHFLKDRKLGEILLRFRGKLNDATEGCLLLGKDMSDLLDRFQDLFDELYINATAISLRVAAETLQLSVGGTPVDFQSEFLLGLRTVGTLNIAWPNLLKHRSDFRFSYQDVIVRQLPGGNALVRDRDSDVEICRVKPVDKFEPAEFEASIEAVQLRDLSTVCICILSNHGLIAVLDCQTEVWNPPELVKQLEDMPSAIAVEGAMHAFAEWHDHFSKREDLAELFDHYDKQTEAAVEQLYVQLICPGWDGQRQGRVAAAMKQRGLFSLFPETLHKLIARISLLSALGQRVEIVAEGIGWSAEATSKFIESLNATAREMSDFEPFVLKGSIVRSRI